MAPYTLEECPAAKDEHILCWCGNVPCAVRLDGQGFHARPGRITNPAEFADALPVEETALLLGDYSAAVLMERLGILPEPWRELAKQLRPALHDKQEAQSPAGVKQKHGTRGGRLGAQRTRRRSGQGGE